MSKYEELIVDTEVMARKLLDYLYTDHGEEISHAAAFQARVILMEINRLRRSKEGIDAKD